MDRPSALDLAFLDLETPQAPLHVGWTLRFAGAPPSLAALRRHLDARLDLVPRFRRRLVCAPPVLGAPHWADDPGFDVARHAFAITLPSPGGGAELREAAGMLLSRPLPPDRPLWRLYLVDGLEPDGFALVGQVHHALVDGVAAVEVALLLFGPEADRAAGRPWTPAAAATTHAAVRATAAGRARAAGAAAVRLAGAARPGALAAARDAARAVEAIARPAPPTALDVSVTRERVVGWAAAPLDAVREAGARRGATVNDVLLAASALAVGRALRRRGEHPATVRALVPVDVRREDPGALGNRISFLTIDLPLADIDADRVLRTVRARTRAAKAGGDAGPLGALAEAADALPGAGRRLLASAAARLAGFNLVVSNVPGPTVTLELLGRPLTAIHPMVPLLHGHALSISAVSYDGRLHLGLGADAAVVPDVVAIARDLEGAFDALRVAAQAPRRATPWRARARARRQQAAHP